jgi:hypothetical protein
MSGISLLVKAILAEDIEKIKFKQLESSKAVEVRLIQKEAIRDNRKYTRVQKTTELINALCELKVGAGLKIDIPWEAAHSIVTRLNYNGYKALQWNGKLRTVHAHKTVWFIRVA